MAYPAETGRSALPRWALLPPVRTYTRRRRSKAHRLAHTMHEGCDFGGHAFEYRGVEA